MMRLNCVCCGSDSIVAVGEIPSAINFAGRLLSVPIEGGSLIKCAACGLAFRYPRLSKTELDAFYRQGNVDTWKATLSKRIDYYGR